MGAREVEAFLSHLAVDAKVAAATQNQALSALLFLHRKCLASRCPSWATLTHAKRRQRLPVMLTREEVREVLSRMRGVYAAMAGLLYGTGMHLRECVRLRVKDVEFAQRQITVRDGRAPGIG